MRGDLVSRSGTLQTHRRAVLQSGDSSPGHTGRQSDRMKTGTVVNLFLIISQLSCGAVLSKVSQSSLETTINVRVSRVVPRHQCRRALRNLEVREKLKLN